jgi:inosine-uridine nucleoside N-ribohydrolase
MFRIVFLVSAILLNSCLLTTLAQPRKVIIDCDPGIDDAIALILALRSSRFDIIGITTVFGNASLEQGTKNALRVVELSGKNNSCLQRCGKPLRVPLRPPPDFVHGKDGLGNTDQPEPKISAHEKSAAQFIVDMAKQYPGQITVLAVGRLTNLAQAIQLDSNVTRNVKEVV